MTNSSAPVGVFDSGVGGISVLGELFRLMPNENYIYFGDSKNAPYGTKTSDEIKTHTNRCVEYLISRRVKAVVIACNTATSVAAADLRQKYDIPIIGIEPAVKPAATEHRGEKILVMATPVTLAKEKFTNLMESYSSMSEIIPLPCPNLVEIIEQGIISGKEVESYLKKLFAPFDSKSISAVVLGCTHYPFIKDSVKKYFDYKVDVIDGGEGTARETKRRLASAGLCADETRIGKIEFISSKNSKEETELMKKMFDYAKKQAEPAPTSRA